MEVYTVHAYRWGDKECHSYPVGVYSTRELAEDAADFETQHRGGKYECEVLEYDVEDGMDGGKMRPIVIRGIE